jgi:hypothetical protein
MTDELKTALNKAPFIRKENNTFSGNIRLLVPIYNEIVDWFNSGALDAFKSAPAPEKLVHEKAVELENYMGIVFDSVLYNLYGEKSKSKEYLKHHKYFTSLAILYFIQRNDNIITPVDSTVENQKKMAKYVLSKLADGKFRNADPYSKGTKSLCLTKTVDSEFVKNDVKISPFDMKTLDKISKLFLDGVKVNESVYIPEINIKYISNFYENDTDYNTSKKIINTSILVGSIHAYKSQVETSIKDIDTSDIKHSLLADLSSVSRTELLSK